MRSQLVFGAALALSLAACSSDSSSSSPVPAGPAAACHDPWAVCKSPSECCSGSCLSGLCVPSDVGGACSDTGDCLSGLTCKSRVCVAGNVCRDLSDVCTWDDDCCSAHCSSSYRCVANSAPIASAGADRAVAYRSFVTVSGTSSRDPDGDPITYAWTLSPPEGSTAALASTASSGTSFYADVTGVYVITLTVSDGVLSSSATVRLTAQNLAPVASAGTNRSVTRNTLVTLDGRGSSDPNGDPLTYSWALTSLPAGSGATLANAGTATPTFTPDVAGPYVAQLSVSDGSLTSTASVTITAVDPPPIANAGPASTANVGNAFLLDGGASADPDGEAITYAWTMTGRPATSTATLSGAATVRPAFTPDVEGTYTFSLTVADGSKTSTPATVPVTAIRHFAVLPYDVVDAEYSAALDRIVVVSASPASALLIVDPVTETAQSIALNKAPLCVSVSLDGKSAVVGHDAMLSVVDLVTATRTMERPVAVKVGDVVLGSGFAYAFPASGAQWTNIYTVNLATGAVTLSTGSSIYGGDRAKLHAGGAAIYGVTTGLSPGNMENFAINAKGVANYGWASPYWGDHSFGSDLWMSQDGTHVFTSSGNVFATTPLVQCIVAPCGVFASAGTPSDMAYVGALAGPTWIRHASHSSLVHRLAVIPAPGWSTPNADTVMQSFDDTYFTLDAAGTVALPPLAGPGAGYAMHGRFAFWRSDATRRYALVQGEPGTPAATTFGLVDF